MFLSISMDSGDDFSFPRSTKRKVSEIQQSGTRDFGVHVGDDRSISYGKIAKIITLQEHVKPDHVYVRVPSMNPVLNQQQQKSEALRLETFHSWPISASQNPEALAKNGFYYIGPSDRVRCAFCSGILKSWRFSDDPCREHKIHFPQCPFVRNIDVGNIPISSGNRPVSIIRPQITQFGRVWNIKYSQFADKDARLKSLEDLPSNVPQDRDLLATAGFFYAGHGDSVCCFSCGGTLRSWEQSDDPWIEHAAWFPRCPYVIEKKGEQFVRDIQSNFTSNRPAIQSPHRESPQPLRKVATSLKDPSGGLEDRIMCKICMDKEVEVTFIPCGHLVSCEKCSKLVKQCPVCRKSIRGTIRTYLA